MINNDLPLEVIPEKESPKPRRQKFRAKVFIFLVCLMISGSMWVFIELMKDYTTDITYSLAFTNVPKDLILVNQADSSIVAGVNAQGFELMVAQFFRKRQQVEIDLSELRIRQDEDGYTAFIPASRIIQQVTRQLTYAKSINSIKPDTLFFRFSEVYRKRVPVRPDVSYSCASQFQLYDSVRFSPQYITVSSIKNVIDTIRWVSTQHIELKDLDSSRVVSVPLKKPLRSDMIRFSQDSVTLKLDVRKYTEALFTVPVTIRGNILPIRIFPDQVEVTCQIPFSDFRDISAGGFSAEVVATPNMLSANKKLPVVLISVPNKVRMVRIKPDQVEYIMISR